MRLVVTLIEIPPRDFFFSAPAVLEWRGRRGLKCVPSQPFYAEAATAAGKSRRRVRRFVGDVRLQ
jgi:hypothetical protein